MAHVPTKIEECVCVRVCVALARVFSETTVALLRLHNDLELRLKKSAVLACEHTHTLCGHLIYFRCFAQMNYKA